MRQAYLFLIEIHPQISRRRRRRIQENFSGHADCWSGISKICWKIVSRVNVRIDTQPPGHGSEPRLDFIVTDLDGMLAQLCGPGAVGVRSGFSGSEIADQLRGVDLACFCPTGQPCHADASLEIANLEGKP
jgi:hypothetical protein